MSRLDSGVTEYVHCQAVVDVFFPVGKNGVAYENCNQCFYFVESTQRCALTKEKSAFPNQYVGDCCPLKPVNISDDGEIMTTKEKEFYE